MQGLKAEREENDGEVVGHVDYVSGNVSRFEKIATEQLGSWGRRRSAGQAGVMNLARL